MIAPSDVTAWSAIAPWATPDQIEQDLDYVRTTSGGVGHLLDAVREVAEHVGFQDVRSRVGVHPKIVLRTTRPRVPRCGSRSR